MAVEQDTAASSNEVGLLSTQLKYLFNLLDLVHCIPNFLCLTQSSIQPSSLQIVLEYFKRVYGNPPIYVHENGSLFLSLSFSFSIYLSIYLLMVVTTNYSK